MTATDHPPALTAFAHSIGTTDTIRTPHGIAINILATAAETGGALGVLVETYAPGTGFPMHVHKKEHEALFMLEGQLLYEAAGQRFMLEPGGFFFGPMGVPHGFRAVGEVPARFVELFLPGGLEEVFGHPDELAGYLAAGTTGEKYGLEVVGGLPE